MGLEIRQAGAERLNLTPCNYKELKACSYRNLRQIMVSTVLPGQALY